MVRLLTVSPICPAMSEQVAATSDSCAEKMNDSTVAMKSLNQLLGEINEISHKMRLV